MCVCTTSSLFVYSLEYTKSDDVVQKSLIVFVLKFEGVIKIFLGVAYIVQLGSFVSFFYFFHLLYNYTLHHNTSQIHHNTSNISSKISQ